MRVTTPAMKLDLRLDTLEVRALLKLALRPAVPWWVLRGRDVARA